MKPGIHPEYETAQITCACGRVTETRSTVGEIHVEICSHCHPFFTGRQKLVDTAGRVERFFAKYGTGDASSGASEDGGADAPPVAEAEEAENVEEAPAAEMGDAAPAASAAEGGEEAEDGQEDEDADRDA